MIVAYTTWGYPPKRARETRKKAREGQIFTKHAVLIIFIQKILQSADSRAISGPKLLFEGCGVASGGFFPAKNAFFGKKVTCTSKKKVLREGFPEPGTPLDRRGPRF